MPLDDALRYAAERNGVQQEFWDIFGRLHKTAPARYLACKVQCRPFNPSSRRLRSIESAHHLLAAVAGGPEASQKGLGDLMPTKLTEISGMGHR
jgi:hypothetical protein